VKRIERADLPRVGAVSLVGISVYHLSLNTAQQTVSPGVAALLIQTAPVRTWLGILIAAVGTAILVVGSGKDLEFSASALLIVGCAVATSVYFVFGRPMVRKYGARSFTTWTMTIGVLPFLVFAPGLIEAAPAASRASAISLVYIGVLPAALMYILWNYAIGELGASRVSLLLYLSPIVAMATQWAWFGTVPSVGALLGGAIALAGTAVATRG
jgi:drug/metabolite transporter (DMT)-like permease